MIAENIARVQHQIDTSCKYSNQHLKEITLIAISKQKTIGELMQAYDAGIRHFGENYLQEALPKIKALNNYAAQDKIVWHYTGQLQTKKLKEIVRHFQVIHSLDCIEHAKRLSQYAALTQTAKLQVFVQINLDGEPQKSGIAPETVRDFIGLLQSFNHLEILGLMLIPKPGTSEETLKKFKEMKVISKQLISKTRGKLSMGMSADYLLAVEAGATHLRIGNVIFGKR